MKKGGQEDYLAVSEYIDWHHPTIQKLATELSSDLTDKTEITRRCFEWVRDNVRHTGDHNDNTVTCRASDVLAAKTGYCYAKSHLLAALLRANNIPAGLCYQRLSVDDHPEGTDPPINFCLHGLNAIYLEDIGWYRIDPRGNKPGVNAQFTPPHEQLAFPLNFPEEADLPEIWPKPLQIVVDVLEKYHSHAEMIGNFPDIELINRN